MIKFLIYLSICVFSLFLNKKLIGAAFQTEDLAFLIPNHILPSDKLIRTSLKLNSGTELIPRQLMNDLLASVRMGSGIKWQKEQTPIIGIVENPIPQIEDPRQWYLSSFRIDPCPKTMTKRHDSKCRPAFQLIFKHLTPGKNEKNRYGNKVRMYADYAAHVFYPISNKNIKAVLAKFKALVDYAKENCTRRAPLIGFHNCYLDVALANITEFEKDHLNTVEKEEESTGNLDFISWKKAIEEDAQKQNKFPEMLATFIKNNLCEPNKIAFWGTAGNNDPWMFLLYKVLKKENQYELERLKIPKLDTKSTVNYDKLTSSLKKEKKGLFLYQNGLAQQLILTSRKRMVVPFTKDQAGWEKDLPGKFIKFKDRSIPEYTLSELDDYSWVNVGSDIYPNIVRPNKITAPGLRAYRKHIEIVRKLHTNIKPFFKTKDKNIHNTSCLNCHIAGTIDSGSVSLNNLHRFKLERYDKNYMPCVEKIWSQSKNLTKDVNLKFCMNKHFKDQPEQQYNLLVNEFLFHKFSRLRKSDDYHRLVYPSFQLLNPGEKRVLQVGNFTVQDYAAVQISDRLVNEAIDAAEEANLILGLGKPQKRKCNEKSLYQCLMIHSNEEKADFDSNFGSMEPGGLALSYRQLQKSYEICSSFKGICAQN